VKNYSVISQCLLWQKDSAFPVDRKCTRSNVIQPSFTIKE